MGVWVAWKVYKKCFSENLKALKVAHLKGLENCSCFVKTDVVDKIAYSLLAQITNNKTFGTRLATLAFSIKNPLLCVCSCVRVCVCVHTHFPLSQHLKLQNELPLTAAQSLRSKKRQNLTKKLILGHLWNSIIRAIFQTPASSANRLWNVKI